MNRASIANTRQTRAWSRAGRTTTQPLADPGTPPSGGFDEHDGPGSRPLYTVVPAYDLVERLAAVPALGPVTLGYGPGLLCPSLTELAEEPSMRGVITCAWASRLGISDTPDANASTCLAALADITGRLLEFAEAAHSCTGADWRIDPADVAVGYAPPNAPAAAVCLRPRDVRLAPPTRDTTPRERNGPGQIWPAMDPLIHAWSQDADLDINEVSRTLE